MVLDIVANQIVQQIEAEKNGQERAHASTPLSMALNLIFDLRVEDTEVTKVDKRAASFVPRQTQDKNAMGNECFRQRILFIFLSTLFILPFQRLHV